MVVIMSAVLLAFTLLFAPALSADGGYSQNGADWTGVCQSGTTQSPIDIQGYTDVDSSDGFSLLSFSFNSMTSYTKTVSGYSYKYSGVHGSLSAVDNAKLSNYTTYGTSMSFHAPSEHYLDGKQYAGEMHIQYEPTSSTNSSPYAYTVVVVFFEEGAENSFLTAFQSTSPASLNLNTLFSSNTVDNYYMYKGSKTSFPCAEAAQYYVLDQIYTASAAQLKVFTDLWASNPSFAGGKGNNRALQNLNGRTIYHFDDSSAATTVLGLLFGLFLVA